MAKRAGLSNFFRAAGGICVEILATFMLMAVMFIIGFIILKWFSK